MKTQILIVIAMVVGLALPAAADEKPVDPAVRERVTHLLSGWERIPKPAELHAVPELDRVLESLATDDATNLLVRARAVSSLSVLPADNVRARAVLERFVSTEATNPVLRRAAVKSYVVLRGPEAALPVVQPVLAHADLALRRAAFEALAPHAALPSVQKALQARLALESSEVLRERLQGAIAPAAPATR